jgi:hypothetical protein
MKTSESTQKISPDLIVAQSKIKHATKDSNNPHFKNDYASLESVIDATKAALLENNIVLMQGMSEDGNVLVTRLQHSSGEFFETYVKLVLSKQDMQGLGSAITYARRYALAAICNISQQDDDGNGASERPASTRPSRTPKGTSPISKSEVARASHDDF